ncbi:hypothetical protein HMPREF1544_02896 [Mucor circinelloides 1006PhL]|uniref:C2H2-type domain-containing protein n=1 Tax=Mucor circinelloides f. circinelloides (strain 1006PhL) TaxID=1220926 RepID=S2JNU4_MUCC1|nr:hypothetical protein HMPREF1544_02896 [Mucor circinelloides 1006PhL]
MVESDYIGPANNRVMINHQQITYADGLSLSGASACSSMDIRTPDIHPVYSNSNSIPNEMVGQTIATQSSLRDQLTSPTTANAPTQQWHQYQDASMMWTSTTDTSVDPSICLSYPPSIHSEENDESSSNSCLSEIEEKMMLYSNSPHLLVETNEEDLSSSSMRKSPNNRRNTVSSFPCTDEWCDPTEKDMRRQSMNSFLIKPRLKLEEQQEEESNTSFCHLSREELIQRVVQLEREKQLNSKLSGSTASAAVSSDKEGPNSPNVHHTADGSDEDEVHPCRWSGCDTSATSLDQLIVHIKDVHIGSGKAAYFCEWESCPREQKPFLKRHKMQNHMRTHTGERPFECHVEGCDKRFSRPDSLNTHVKTHSSIRPYACLFENCSKAYFHSRSLRKHTKSHETAAAAGAGASAGAAIPGIAVTVIPASANSTIATNATEVDMKEEDVIVQRQHPYDRSLKPTRYYRQQTTSCGSEARQQQQTPSNLVMRSANFTPMMINTALLQQQTQQQQLYGDAKMMEICEPASQEQQIFAAGPAYNDEYNPHVVEQQLFQHHQRLQQQQLLDYQHQQQQQQLSYQHHPQHPQAFVSYNNNNNQSLSVQQQQPSYHDYNYITY